MKKTLAEHVFEGINNDFTENVSEGDIIVAGYNFGYGSSREHAVMALKGAGIKAVIAKSFARIFYRNSINLGLPPIVCPTAAVEIKENDDIETDMDLGKIKIVNRNREFQFEKFPDFIMNYFNNGGLINTLNKDE